MDTEKSISILNSLIEINNDRIEGYETASEETDEADLKTLFSLFRETSVKCKAELVAEVERLGGKPIEGTTTSGKFYRVWMDIKSALTGSDRKSIVNSCEYGEKVAVETYDEALANSEDLTSEQLAMIREQHDAIKANYDKIKNLSNLMA